MIAELKRLHSPDVADLRTWALRRGICAKKMSSERDEWQRLLGKARDGRISRHELDQVVAALKDPQPKADRYTLLHIIGRAMGTSHEDLVASYLDCPADPMLSRIALQILCNYWDKTPRYLEYVRDFSWGVGWDHDEDVRQVAVSIAGNFLRSTWDSELFHILLNVATDDEKLGGTRISAIQGLARAMGDDPRDFPPVTSRSAPDEEWYREVVDRALHRFLEQE